MGVDHAGEDALVEQLADQHGLVVWRCVVQARSPVVTVEPAGESPVSLDIFVENAARMGARALYVDRRGGGDDAGRLIVDFFGDGILHRWTSTVAGADQAGRTGLVDDLVAQLVADPDYRGGRTKKARDGIARTMVEALREAEQDRHPVLTRQDAERVMRDAHDQVEAGIREAYRPIRDAFGTVLDQLNRDDAFVLSSRRATRQARLRQLLTDMAGGWPPPTDLMNQFEERRWRPSDTTIRRRMQAAADSTEGQL